MCVKLKASARLVGLNSAPQISPQNEADPLLETRLRSASRDNERQERVETHSRERSRGLLVSSDSPVQHPAALSKRDRGA
jgi:hypothetical protein